MCTLSAYTHYFIAIYQSTGSFILATIQIIILALSDLIGMVHGATRVYLYHRIQHPRTVHLALSHRWVVQYNRLSAQESF